VGHIQGFIGGLAAPATTLPNWRKKELCKQLVVGHEEYRREAYRSVGFRRAFSEVFRSRSFLFIGSGLSEGYFENLFDETLELQGTLPHMHYALVKKGSLNARFLHERFQIEIIEYDDHKRVADWLGALHREIIDRQSRTVLWGITLHGKDEHRTGDEIWPDLQIVRSALLKPAKGECLLISAGVRRGDKPACSKSGLKLLQTHLVGLSTDDAKLISKKDESKVWRFGTFPAFAAAARSLKSFGRDARDARTVYDAMNRALAYALQSGFQRMYANLLGVGKKRVFAAHVSLIQMIRAFSDFNAQAPQANRLKLTVCIVNPAAIHLLCSGRLDIAEVIYVEKVRFWVEIWRSAEQILRFLEFAEPSCTLRDVLGRFDLPSDGWHALVIPAPTRSAKEILAREIMVDAKEQWTVSNAGLMPGSTLRVLPDSVQSDSMSESQVM
jgi:SIR2-like protein